MAESITPGDQAAILEFLKSLGGVPITLSQSAPARVDTARRLEAKRTVTVVFPPCADDLLAFVGMSGKDDITDYFDEYFRFGTRHRVIGDEVSGQVNEALLRSEDGRRTWPSACCVCAPNMTLDGHRGLATLPAPNPANPAGPARITRLFIADLVWLFYFERMGIFQILGAILDAYACNGRLPISNGSVNEADLRDDVIAVVLELMVRQVKTGMSSAVRDRACAYRTSLGWVSETGRKLQLDTQVNTGFSSLFHKLIYNALEFYKDRRMAVAIRGTAVPTAPPSVATLITIGDTIDLLRKRFEAFAYGRNYYNALSGILWAIGGMAVIRELRTTLGIPGAYNSPHEYIPAAYDLLVAKRAVTQGDANRYLLHRDCARHGRDILLDVEVLAQGSNSPGGELDNWLAQIEPKVEGYRTAYLGLTGVDLGASAAPTIEQQA